jgi:hypothetical protein
VDHDVPDFEEIADRLLPLFGPFEPDAVAAAARTISELVRRLNHATRHAAALPAPSDVYTVLGALRVGLSGLNQTLSQLADRTGRWTDDFHIGHDLGGDPRCACVTTIIQLRRAAAALTAVVEPLEAAQTTIGPLNAQPRHLSAGGPPASPQLADGTHKRGRHR